MIQRVRIKNYRSLGDVEVELGPLTVLVGPNASGKSNFVDALKFIGDALNARLEAAIVNRRGFSQLRRHRARVLTLELSMETPWPRVKSAPAWYAVELEANRDADAGLRIRREHCWVDTDDGIAEYRTYKGKWLKRPVEPQREEPVELEIEAIRRLFSRTLSAPQDELTLRLLGLFPSFYRVERYLQDVRIYTLSLDKLRTPQPLTKGQALSETGENLASVLREDFPEGSKARISLCNAFSAIVDGAIDFRVRNAGSRLVIEIGHRQPGGKEHYFDAAVESDGTLRVLALLAALYQKRRPSLTIIEEPELHLHPGAMGVLVEVLREASLRGQVLVTTQSADLMNELASDELRVVEKLDGVTHIGPVDDEHRKSVEMELFTPGDLIRVRGFRRKVS